MATKTWRWFGLLVVVAMIAGTAAMTVSAQPTPAHTEATTGAAPVQPPPPPDAKKAPEPVHPTAPPPSSTTEEALKKLHPDLRELAQTASPALPDQVGTLAGPAPEPVMVEVFAEAGTDLSPYFVDGKYIARNPLRKGDLNIQVFIGRVYPTSLLKIASLARVQAVIPIVLERNAEPDPYPPDQPREIPKKGPEDWRKLREAADALRAGMLPWSQAKAFGDGRPDIRPSDWFEVRPEGPHQAQDAWARGYRGEGVTVAVLDDGIDPAHPDLLGTQKIYSSTLATAYNGWPYVFSPISMLVYALDSFYGTTYIADGFPGAHYVDTSATPTLTPCGVGTLCFQYDPLIDYGVRYSEVYGVVPTYYISATMTKSGVVHVGTHPDNDLRDFLWGEKVAVLVTDPNTAGGYDTVYVDLDADHDFRDEKPLTRANVLDPTTYNNMVAYRDMNGDGLADISGGALYFIADGVTPIPVSDWMYGSLAPAPANGDLVAFTGSTFDRDYSHGTQCASNIVGQGQTNAMLPTFSDLPGSGKPSGAVFGMAPEAKVVNVSDIYYNFDSSIIDAYIFAAVGYDACDQTGYDLKTGGMCTDSDGIQITTNSYGASNVDNDGWEYEGQVVSQLQRWWAPYLQFLFSTGNGAPGYGTVAPPSPATGIGVGASTEFGSTGWDSITSTTQIMFNDVIPFSNRGPGARGTNGVDVVAGGAYAAGAEELNYYSVSTWGAPDGNRSWASWGGTSRSAPVAGGVLALIYQAYKEANGDWPTYDVARALLKASATDLNYDTFTQGAGSVNADRGTAVAGGHYGIFAMPDEWNPGDYRGIDYPGFAHIAYPGDTFTTTISVVNPSTSTINVTISDAELVRIGSEEFDFTVTPQMVAAESAYGAANRDNFFKAFNYFIPITATQGMDPSWYNIPIPPDTDLMIVRQMYPFDQFDVNGDYTWDNRFYLTVYNWEDVNNDGNVWEDKDGNGVVNFINDPTTYGEQADGAIELAWDDPRTELDRWEFGRFGYNRPAGNVYEMWVHNPLVRMQGGLFIGLRHLYNSNAANITTTLHYRIDFYKKADVTWLEADTTALAVPAGNVATFVVTATVPNDMPAGEYQAGIYIEDPGTSEYEANTTVIPVVLSVAEPFTDGMTLGGMASYTYDADRPYNNGAVRGTFDWTWRAESGDWRFFFSDVADGSYPSDTKFIVKDEWDSAAPHTDIDTIVLGPTPTSMGSGWYDWPEPGFYGPYVLDTVAKSPNTNVSAGIWRFNTSSGANEDWVSGPIQDGLHAFLQHNVLFEGDKFWVPFTKTVGTLAEDTHSFSITTYVDAGLVGTTTLTATLDLNGLEAEGFLIAPETTQWTNEPLGFTGAGTIEWTYVFNVSSAYYLQIWTSSADVSDLDLYLYRQVGSTWQQVASSAGPDANESIYLASPPDGLYMIGIDNYSGPAGHFNMTLNVGKNVGGITVVGATTNPVPANTAVSLGIYYNYPMEPGQCYSGWVLAGPPEAPELKEIPLTICRQPESAGLEKTVNWETGFPGMELQYTLNLFNYNDSNAYFELADPIPAGTEFVTVTGAACLSLPGETYLTEDFDSATPPALPTGWDQVDVSGTTGEWKTATATRYPSGQPPHSPPNLAYFNSFSASSGYSTRLYRTTGLNLSAAGTVQLSFWMYHDTGYLNSNDRVQVQVSTDGGTTWVNVGAPIPRYDGSTGWKEHIVDLSAYAGQSDVRIGFLGISGFGNDCHIDDVVVSAPPTTVCYQPVYDPVSNTVVYTGPLPLATVIVPPKNEGFEGGAVPPLGWTEQISNTSKNWSISTTYRRTGTYGAYVPFDYNQDEWLLSPRLLGVTGGMTTSLWSEGSIYWCRDTYDNCDLNVWLVANGVGGGDDVLLGKAENSWPASWTWARSVFTLPATLPAGDLRIGYQYVGNDGADVGLDDIFLPGTPEPIIIPSAVFTLTVRISDTVAAGSWITNTGTLTATHLLPQETQVEAPVSASAVTHIGAEDFATSSKDAPAEVTAGDTFIYEIHVINTGDALASVTLSDTLPAGLTYVNHWSAPNSPYYAYNGAENRMEWSGNVAPGEEWVFYVEVEVGADPSLWGTELVNSATISWDGNVMPLVARTKVLPPYRVFLPLTLKNYGP